MHDAGAHAEPNVGPNVRTDVGPDVGPRAETDAGRDGHWGEVKALRRFNRFYSRFLEVFGVRWMDSPLSLVQVRLLWEVEHAPGCTATDLMAAMGLDRGHASRLVRDLEGRGLLRRKADQPDRRARSLHLTQKGLRLLEEVRARTEQRLAGLLDHMSAFDRRELLDAMARVEGILGRARERVDEMDDARPDPTDRPGGT